MCNKLKGRAYEARPVIQFYFSKDFIDIQRRNQIISLMQWLQDECHRSDANSKEIIRELFKRTNEMRRGRL